MERARAAIEVRELHTRLERQPALERCAPVRAAGHLPDERKHREGIDGQNAIVRVASLRDCCLRVVEGAFEVADVPERLRQPAMRPRAQPGIV